MAESLFGRLVVNYPRAIPQRQWVLDRLLWADQIGSVWPAGEPTDRNEDEQKLLNDIGHLRDADLFSPCYVPPDAAENLGADIADGLALTDQELRGWSKSLKLEERTESSAVEKADRLPRTVDPDLFFYINKMPPDVVQLLEDSSLANRDANGWLKMRSAGEADRLMSIIAGHAKPVDGAGTSMMLEAPRVKDLGTTAAPTAGAPATSATRIELPLVGGVNPGLEIRDLIDLRQSTRAERARKNFLQEVDHYVSFVLESDEDDPQRGVEAVKRIRSQMFDAVREIERSSNWRDPQLGLGVMAAVVSGLQIDSTLSVIGAVIGGASLALNVKARLRPAGVDGYLLKLHSKGFLSHVPA